MPRRTFRATLLVYCLFVAGTHLAPVVLTAQVLRASHGAEVTFILDFPTSQPQHYLIRVPLEGSCHYESTGKLNSESDDNDDFTSDFSISEDARSKIFALTEKAGYFRKDIDSHRKNLAFTGTKTLRYADGTQNAEEIYNYSNIPAVQQLTGLFQNLSATLEFGHRLDYDHHYQKLAIDEELKRMEELAKQNMLSETKAIQSVLEQIADDPSVINVARARAKRLLAMHASP
jgi:hypothetical protein